VKLDRMPRLAFQLARVRQTAEALRVQADCSRAFGSEGAAATRRWSVSLEQWADAIEAAAVRDIGGTP
jgi:hypothetical protein